MPGISRLRLAAWGATGSNKMTASIATNANPALREASRMRELDLPVCHLASPNTMARMAPHAGGRAHDRDRMVVRTP